VTKKPRAWIAFEADRRLVEKVDGWRYQHRIPTRAAAVRRLLELGMTRKEARNDEVDRT